MMAIAKPKNNRGKIERIKLSKPITFNGHIITDAVIEIDHINRGLDENGNLNKKVRTNFTVKDIEKFIALLDQEDIVAVKYKKSVAIYRVKIDCPITRLHHGKLFIMIFEHDSHKNKELHTVTIYMDGRK